ncbi:MAG: DNA mismatch repair endonuclease MutL, partial [Desulfobacterales bacterium]|nr:DNA mismatch repair endonuclease MutL [Desulfobacterales bacterium]
EVVDRPASVVRELVENSIDAGADRIVINIEKGGKRLIKVSDNGVGMSRDDLLLCVERHATSKISTASDLFSVRSLGFRGEAIPSIASVSRMQIVSRTQDRLEGNRLKITGGKLVSIEETGTPVGTIIEVWDIFFNIPARRKFLRAVKTEADHIIDILSRLALPLPNISFRLDHAGKTIINFPASGKQLPRLFALMGRETAESFVEALGGTNDIDVRAYLAPPDFSRSRGDRLLVYVNGRNIRDRLVFKAVMDAYGRRLMKGQYPQAVIFLEIDPSQVDVNVHPTKQEVRFNNSSAVFQAVVATVQKALSQSFNTFFKQESGKDAGDISHKDNLASVSEPIWNYSKNTEDITGRTEPGVLEEPLIKEAPEIIGQLGNTYILCQTKGGLLMVDQHAAHERIVYETLKKGFENSQIEAQALLMPHEMELSLKEKSIVREKGCHLSSLGIDLDHFGGNTFLLRSHPAILNNVQWDLFLSELLAELEEVGSEDPAFLDKIMAVIACHGAIRAGQHMTHEEMTLLLSQLEEMDLPANCPHGRPIFKHFEYYEIEKMFKRVV